MDISELRKQIDHIDRQLVSLFQERMSVSAQIADDKKGKGLPVYDASRESELLESIAKMANPELEEYTVSLYQTILSLSRTYQEQIIAKAASSTDMEVH